MSDSSFSSIVSAFAAIAGGVVSVVTHELLYRLRIKFEREPRISIDRRNDHEFMSGETFVVVTNDGERPVTVVDVRFDDGSGFRGFSSFTLPQNACREFRMSDARGSGRVSVSVAGGKVFVER